MRRCADKAVSSGILARTFLRSLLKPRGLTSVACSISIDVPVRHTAECHEASVSNSPILRLGRIARSGGHGNPFSNGQTYSITARSAAESVYDS
jgi:hypothetical protein